MSKDAGPYRKPPKKTVKDPFPLNVDGPWRDVLTGVVNGIYCLKDEIHELKKTIKHKDRECARIPHRTYEAMLSVVFDTAAMADVTEHSDIHARLHDLYAMMVAYQVKEPK